MILCDKCEKRRGCRELCPERAAEKKAREKAKKERAILRGYYFNKDRRISHAGCRKTKR